MNKPNHENLHTTRLNGLIEKIITQRGLEKGEPIERKLEELISTGCECGNKHIKTDLGICKACDVLKFCHANGKACEEFDEL